MTVPLKKRIITVCVYVKQISLFIYAFKTETYYKLKNDLLGSLHCYIE